MIIIGVDAPQGWCCLDVAAGKGRLLGLGSLDAGQEAEELTRYITRWRPDVVVIERAEEVYAFGRGDDASPHIRREVTRGLIATAETSGEMRHACRVAGVKCKVTDAKTIRQAIGAKGKTRQDKDRDVARLVSLLVTGWPKRSTTHERDAALAALWGQM